MIAPSTQFWKENCLPYIEALGNCEVVKIPYGHMTYQAKPDEVGEALAQFIEKVDAEEK